MSLGPGSTIGPFRIQSLIGKGGMGEVFSAVDTRVDRRVALKVLPGEFATDTDRLRRFQLEARTLATLNHPNVALLFGFEEVSSQNLLVLELVEGETLADRLRRGALPLEEALRLAIQIAAGVEAAHQKGIVHRDLKPANIKITPDDQAKVLDFGLAKTTDADSSVTATALSDSPTILTGSTIPGLILGTAAYMSPEQAKGKPVDKRTDIWSFGCVLYECLTAKRPFEGESVTDCIGAVLHKEPDWSAVPPNTPVQIQLLLRRCLAKDRNKRLHDIADARLELESALSGSSIDSLLPARPFVEVQRKRTSVTALVVAGILGVLLGIGGGVAVLRQQEVKTRSPELARKFLIRLPGVPRDNDSSFAISPDGSRLAYISNSRLYIRNLTDFEASAREIPNSQGALLPFWSPDGEWVGFALGRKLYRVRSTGSQPQPVAEAPEAFAGAGGGAWLRDNTIVFGTGGMTNGFLRVPASGGPSEVFVATEPLTEIDFHDPAPLPDGKSILFVVHGARNGVPTSEINTIAVSSGKTKQIVYRHPIDGRDGQILDLAYSPTGHILFGLWSGASAAIWALPFSVSEMKATGEATLLYAGAAFPSISADGTLVFSRRDPDQLLRLARFDRSGRLLSNFGTLQYHNPLGPAWARDGKRAISTVFNADGRTADLWMHDATNSYQLTFVNEYAFIPDWSPDGSNVLFLVQRSGSQERRLMVIPSSGGETRELFPGVRGIFTPDGRAIVYASSPTPRTGPFEIRTSRFPVSTNPPVTLFKTEGFIGPFRLSPDGRFIAYESGDDSSRNIVLTRFPSFTGKWQINHPLRSFDPQWCMIDGRSYLFFTDEAGTIFEVSINVNGDSLVPGPPRMLFERNVSGLRSGRSRSRPPGFAVAADGQEFLVPALPETAPQEMFLTVVDNLAAELKR